MIVQSIARRLQSATSGRNCYASSRYRHVSLFQSARKDTNNALKTHFAYMKKWLDILMCCTLSTLCKKAYELARINRIFYIMNNFCSRSPINEVCIYRNISSTTRNNFWIKSSNRSKFYKRSRHGVWEIYVKQKNES